MTQPKLSPERALEMAEVSEELGRIALTQLRLVMRMNSSNSKVRKLRLKWAARLAQAHELKKMIEEGAHIIAIFDTDFDIVEVLIHVEPRLYGTTL